MKKKVNNDENNDEKELRDHIGLLRYQLEEANEENERCGKHIETIDDEIDYLTMQLEDRD